METREPILAEHPVITGLRPAHIPLVVGGSPHVSFDAG